LLAPLDGVVPEPNYAVKLLTASMVDSLNIERFDQLFKN
jgi:hypothetical protein